MFIIVTIYFVLLIATMTRLAWRDTHREVKS